MANSSHVYRVKFSLYITSYMYVLMINLLLRSVCCHSIVVIVLCTMLTGFIPYATVVFLFCCAYMYLCYDLFVFINFYLLNFSYLFPAVVQHYLPAVYVAICYVCHTV